MYCSVFCFISIYLSFHHSVIVSACLSIVSIYLSLWLLTWTHTHDDTVLLPKQELAYISILFLSEISQSILCLSLTLSPSLFFLILTFIIFPLCLEHPLFLASLVILGLFFRDRSFAVEGGGIVPLPQILQQVELWHNHRRGPHVTYTEQNMKLWVFVCGWQNVFVSFMNDTIFPKRDLFLWRTCVL